MKSLLVLAVVLCIALAVEASMGRVAEAKKTVEDNRLYGWEGPEPSEPTWPEPTPEPVPEPTDPDVPEVPAGGWQPGCTPFNPKCLKNY